MTNNLVPYIQNLTGAWNSHDIEKVLRFYSFDCVGNDVGQASILRGREGVRSMLEMYWNAFPDLQFAITDTIVQDSRVVIVWVAEGTHQGPILNIPPTGHKVKVRGVSIIDVKDGLVVESQYIWDLAGMLRHMGLLPAL